MNQERSNEITVRLLRLSTEHPALFMARVLPAALFLHLLIILALALLVAALLAGVLVAISLFSVIVLIFLGITLLRWVRPISAMRAILRGMAPERSLPVGIAVGPGRAPELHALVEGVRRDLGMSEIAEIRITPDFSFGLLRRERRGLLGQRKEYLQMGLPLMMSLSAGQLEAVLTQQLAYRTGRYARLLRLFLAAINIETRLEGALKGRDHWGSRVMSFVTGWYGTSLYPYVTTLTILATLEADRRAADEAGAAWLGSAMIDATVAGAFLDRVYWPHRSSELAGSAAPPPDAISGIPAALREQLDPEQAKVWLNEVLATDAIAVDGHVTLPFRLSRIGVDASFRGLAEESAARTLLASELEPLAAELDAEQRSRIALSWAEGHHDAVSSRRKLEELKRLDAEGAELSLLQLHMYAELTAGAHGDEAAEPIHRRILEQTPDDARSRLALGSALLARGDESGLAEIERAIELDATLVVEGVGRMHAYHSALRNFIQADALSSRYGEIYRQEMERRNRLVTLGQAERAHLRYDDHYHRHNLSEVQLARVQELVSGIPGIVEAFLACKQVHYSPEQPLYVLGVARRRSMGRYLRRDEEEMLVQRIMAELSMLGDIRIVMLDSRVNRPMGAILRKVKGARIYGA